MSPKSVGQIISVNGFSEGRRTLGFSHSTAKSLSFERSLARAPGVSQTLRAVSHVQPRLRRCQLAGGSYWENGSTP